MKRVSAKLFFTVLWRGVCQALGWFFGLFGYKRDDKFSKCVWRVFAVSASIITAFLALIFVCAFVEVIYKRYYQPHYCDDEYCLHSEYIKRDIYFHNTHDGKGYVFNKQTGEKLIRHIAWIAKPLGNDSLVCFSDGKKRGYFSKNTGKVIIEPQYDHAWVFSDGLASVEKDGQINFIDGTGKVVINCKLAYYQHMIGYVFHGGYCVVYGDKSEGYGLIDKTGKTVMPFEYSDIQPSTNAEMWVITKNGQSAALDKYLRTVIPLTKCSMDIGNKTINMTMPDHTIRKYDLQGELINDFYVKQVRMLEYEKDEVLYRDIKTKEVDECGETVETVKSESWHPMATAYLRAYEAGDGRYGLMAPDGRIVTMPLYDEIQAIANDRYLCTCNRDDKVVVNGKGEIVK